MHRHRHTHTHTHTDIVMLLYINVIIQNVLFWNSFFFNVPYVLRVLCIFVLILSCGSKDFCATSWLFYWWTLKLFPMISIKSNSWNEYHFSCTSVCIRACLCAYVRMFMGWRSRREIAGPESMRVIIFILLIVLPQSHSNLHSHQQPRFPPLSQH